MIKFFVREEGNTDVMYLVGGQSSSIHVYYIYGEPVQQFAVITQNCCRRTALAVWWTKCPIKLIISNSISRSL